MTLSRRASWFLLAVGVWSWLIWPRFLKAIWADDRSWHHGPTAFFLVHLVLVVASLAIGTAVGWLGLRGVRAWRGAGPQSGERTMTTPSVANAERTSPHRS
ncbi:hypothetical protein EV189_2066 [Motilibacter rhizosphaerae]|uniref:Uncharacterized protein n=1 Tax=Motilibacter rhizosphaerae TaxID=598652 RepID=A0A4Q7NV40_9ACTN|nr:hypothetical protein [Motilibacter rhizosphaerae]RZS90282.1 hypothetical protein EV189_2066 [Motilibacter rhizosphaerae]